MADIFTTKCANCDQMFDHNCEDGYEINELGSWYQFHSLECLIEFAKKMENYIWVIK